MAANNPSVLKALARQGYGALNPASGLKALQKLTQAEQLFLGSNVMISSFDWPTFLQGMHKDIKAAQVRQD